MAALLGGCGPARLLDSLTPEGAYRRAADIAYGGQPRQRLDVYRPSAPDARRTALLFLYGGGWRSGAKADYRFVAETLTRRGITVIIADYRLYPEVVFPAFVEDAALALRWVHDNAMVLDIDPRRVFVAGHSAGAHSAALLALDPRYRAAVGLGGDSIAGVVGIAGPYDFRPMAPSVAAVFGAAANLPESQPVTFATGGAPPMLLLHGRDDRTVFPENSERLARRLKAAGVPVRLRLYERLGHVEIMLGLSSVFMGNGEMLRDIAEFFAAPHVS